MTTELREAIARLRRGDNLPDDVEAVCDALEEAIMKRGEWQEWAKSAVNGKKFDKVAYQREYMRKWRTKK